jgi:diguanylate cyclase (GGDEF)-like protein
MYIATYSIDIAALLYLMWLLHSSTALDSRRKKPFSAAIILTVTVILAEAGTIFAGNGNVAFRSLNIFCNVVGFALTPIIPLAIALIFYSDILRTHKILLVPTYINIVATVLSPWFGFVFHVNASNQYFRGDYFFVFMAAYIFNFLFLVVRTVDTGRQYNYPIMRKMIALSMFTITSTSIQLIEPLAYSSWHGVTLSLFLYFLLISEFDNSFDTLTGLYNRATFDKIARELVSAKGYSVMVLDINDFKSVNDTYGHDYGDQVIQSVAEIIKDSFDQHYTCYRYGGDEFSIIGSETDSEKIEEHLRSMTDALEEMRNRGKILPTISYGYSISPGGGRPDLYKALKEADDQMYQFKKVHKANAGREATVSSY